MMRYAQIEMKPFPYFFVDVGCWERYSVDVKDAHQKISKILHWGNKYEQSKTLVCSYAGGIDAVALNM